jgi:hypothetical protein
MSIDGVLNYVEYVSEDEYIVFYFNGDTPMWRDRPVTLVMTKPPPELPRRMRHSWASFCSSHWNVTTFLPGDTFYLRGFHCEVVADGFVLMDDDTGVVVEITNSSRNGCGESPLEQRP